MTSAHDEPSEEAQGELNGLLNVSLDVAAEQLTTVGEFYPYAVAVGLDGQPRLVTPDMGTEEHPDSSVVLERCIEALVAARKDFRASAVIVDVRLNDADTDAIRVDLEHAEGLSLRILLPYVKSADDGLVFGEMQAEQAVRAVWG
ncbi:MAG: hypothetical protein ACT4QF_08685 [Sporichthyaceae bacterium]